ncbi:MAG: histidine phosphatase family protein [bacterium]|nr:histidine phosphatase family protein [bacterium]MDZ4285454.1 histidine phosphatase family protein [Candidatus Sungbacteria bacterium]
MQFILTLHCETSWNLEGILQGHIDTELHNAGRVNAYRKALALRREYPQIVGIVTSDLRRGIQTGEIINECFNVPHGIYPGLRECGYGSLEGKAKGEISVTPEWSDPHDLYDYQSFGGESYDQVVRRQREVLDGLVSRYDPADLILVVGHGTSINSLLHFLGKPNLPMKRHEIRTLDY